jgi:carbamoyltransferase
LKRHKDIAAALQMITEEILLKIINHIYKSTKLDNLVISGGVGLNSVFNGKIISNTPFKNIWIPPDPGDGGTSIGATIYTYNTLLDNKRNYVLKNPYLGPSFSNDEIKHFLDDNNIEYSEFENEEILVKTIAKSIYENKIVGWFQEGMEWGPRALGARSILANPCNPDMKDILNNKVKHREGFRPFAPIVCRDDADKFFICDKPIPDSTDFMIHVYNVKNTYLNRIPSAVHVDKSARLQTIKKDQNLLLYNLIKEFGKLSGIPILINTSFNVRGEPIVCSPFDAYSCMMGTGIDILIIGRNIIHKEENF